uniref:SAM domain-containing protein n=4 Tax=Callorhinchus milii TaxID=7868 RepID=A0A4W3HPH2_CALMI
MHCNKKRTNERDWYNRQRSAAQRERSRESGAASGWGDTHVMGYQRSRREKSFEGSASLSNPPSDAASPASKCVKEQLKDIQECPDPGLKKDTHKTESVQCSSSQINCKNKISGSSHPTRSSTFSNCGDHRKSHGINGHTPGASGHSTDQWLYGECIGNHGEEAAKRMLLVRLSSPDQAVRNDKTEEEAVPEQSAAVPEVRGASCLPTPSASPVEMENNENGSLDTKNLVENGKPFDPAEWTILDVFNYFKKAGFEEQAIAFQEQEIDGKSLLLMKRSDVLTGLSIKLGPALKIYEYHVKALQMRHLKNSSS